MTYSMFLDDERFPPNNDVDWVIARSYEIAVGLVVENGCPEFISFDHDLGEGNSGYDFAWYLINKDMKSNIMPKNFSFDIHSQNMVGKFNISFLLNGYLRFKNEYRE